MRENPSIEIRLDGEPTARVVLLMNGARPVGLEVYAPDADQAELAANAFFSAVLDDRP